MVKASRVAAGSLIFKFDDIAAHAGVDILHDALPLRLGDAAEDRAQQQFFVAAKGVVHVRFEFANLIDFSIDLGNLAVGHGSIGGRFLEMRHAEAGMTSASLLRRL